MLPRTLKSATIGDQDKQNSEDNNLPVKTSTNTQLNTRGNVVVNSSSVKSTSLSGRRTKTSIKALKPLSPPVAKAVEIVKNKNKENGVFINSLNAGVELCQAEQINESSPARLQEAVSLPPTHPARLSPDLNLPIFPFPTISQLRDYPDLTLPCQLTQPSVIVKLPGSAPVSPTVRRSNLDLESGSPCTPKGQFNYNEQSVVLNRPGFPNFNPQSSTPASSARVGSWDNFFEISTYQGPTQEFWGSRKIQIVSTDIFDLEDPLHLDNSNASINSLEKALLNQIQIISHIFQQLCRPKIRQLMI